jgi:hypothetical protein
MTIVIHFHQTRFRTFKDYYVYYVIPQLKKYFPNLISYNRFIQLMAWTIFPLFNYLNNNLGKCSGISFIDSSVLSVCHNRRISSHKVFKGIAKRGKTSTGWYFGFKLHFVINQTGELLSFMITAANIDDRSPVLNLAKDLFGKLFGDKGYLSSKLFKDLLEKGVQLITKIRRKMKNKLMKLTDKLILKRRGLIESVINKLKNDNQIEHHRHRSKWNFIVNLFSGLIAYMQDPHKPTLKISKNEKKLFLAM